MPAYDVPISDRMLFPVHNTVEEYKKATGLDAPKYDGKQPKYWFDPAARELAKTKPDEEFEYLVAAIKDGKPALRYLTLPAFEAGSVNIPTYADMIMDATGQKSILRAKVPNPISPMLPGEEMVLSPISQVVVFRNVAAWKKSLEQVDAFMASDRDAIHEKLDAILKAVQK